MTIQGANVIIVSIKEFGNTLQGGMYMRVLVIGSGGREHALAWKLAQSPKVSQVFCAPGNDGIGRIAELVPIAVDEIERLLEWAKSTGVDLTVVGPEVPLTLGIVDQFEAEGLRVFGPRKDAAQIEGSKAFAKDLMEKYSIPTAAYRTFTEIDAAKAFIQEQGVPVVVKADGLAAGKGVIVAHEMEEALTAVEQLLQPGTQIVVEEFLHGVEMSLLALTDGKTILPMTPAHDHKAVFDGDQGPNTGGMGAFSPSYLDQSQELVEQIMKEVILPTVSGLKEEGILYKGVLYAGIMLTKKGLKVLEFNARFGDPETQVILPRLENDLLEVMQAVTDEKLSEIELAWKEEKALAVILTSGGYPGSYEKGKEISGLDANGQILEEKITIFHAGTNYQDGKWFTNGGRVIAITALGQNFDDVQKRAYQVVEQITFADQHYRRDIGNKAL